MRRTQSRVADRLLLTDFCPDPRCKTVVDPDAAPDHYGYAAFCKKNFYIIFGKVFAKILTILNWKKVIFFMRKIKKVE
jgi:hypothetical protein